MASQGTTLEGLDDIGSLAWVSGALTLIAYTNAANSLGPNTALADITQPSTANGYTPIVLDGTWVFAGGVGTYTHTAGANYFSGNAGWLASGTWSATVNGCAIFRGTKLRHFKDLSSPFVAAAGKKLVPDLNSVLG